MLECDVISSASLIPPVSNTSWGTRPCRASCKLTQFPPESFLNSGNSAQNSHPEGGSWCWMEPPSLFPMGWGTRNQPWTHSGCATGTSSLAGECILNKMPCGIPCSHFWGCLLCLLWSADKNPQLNSGHGELGLIGLEIKMANCAPLLVFANIFQSSWVEGYAGVK